MLLTKDAFWLKGLANNLWCGGEEHIKQCD